VLMTIMTITVMIDAIAAELNFFQLNAVVLLSGV